MCKGCMQAVYDMLSQCSRGSLGYTAENEPPGSWRGLFAGKRPPAGLAPAPGGSRRMRDAWLPHSVIRLKMYCPNRAVLGAEVGTELQMYCLNRAVSHNTLEAPHPKQAPAQHGLHNTSGALCPFRHPKRRGLHCQYIWSPVSISAPETVPPRIAYGRVDLTFSIGKAQEGA